MVVTVSLLRSREEGGVLVTTTLRRGENSLARVDTELRLGDTRDISVETPAQLGLAGHQAYSLEVVGEDLYRVERKIFQERVPLDLWSPGHVISVDLPDLARTGHQLAVRVSVLLSDLSHYTGPATISLLSPAGDLVTREILQLRGVLLPSLSWDSVRTTDSSSVEFRYQLDRRAPTGLWSVRVSTDRAEVRRNLTVLDYRPGRMEVTVSLPSSVSASQPSLSGVVTANYSQSGLPVCGNISLTAITSLSNGTLLSSKVMELAGMG